MQCRFSRNIFTLDFTVKQCGHNTGITEKFTEIYVKNCGNSFRLVILDQFLSVKLAALSLIMSLSIED